MDTKPTKSSPYKHGNHDLKGHEPFTRINAIRSHKTVTKTESCNTRGNDHLWFLP